MIQIGIDIDNILRGTNYSFLNAYDKEFSLKHSFKKKEMKKIVENINPAHCRKYVPFHKKVDYNRFVNIDYPYEINALSYPLTRDTLPKFMTWKNDSLLEQIDDYVEIVLLTTGENDIAQNATMFFLSKGFRVNHILMGEPKRLWYECDVIISTNPKLLKAKPDKQMHAGERYSKRSVKINREFNKKVHSDLSYNSFIELMNDKKFISKLNLIKYSK